MAMFNRYFANHFGGCQLLAEAHDQHRARDVRIYLIPGTVEVVGVTDGVDCWVCPTSISPFSVDIKNILERLQEGTIRLPVRAPGMPGQSAPGKRVRIRVSDDPPVDPPNRPRSRVLVDPGQSEPHARRRVRIN